MNPPNVVTVVQPGSIIGQPGKTSINTVFAPVPIDSWCLRFMQRPEGFGLATPQVSSNGEAGSA